MYSVIYSVRCSLHIPPIHVQWQHFFHISSTFPCGRKYHILSCTKNVGKLLTLLHWKEMWYLYWKQFWLYKTCFSTFASSYGSLKYDVRTRGSQVHNSEKRRDANGGGQGTNSEKVNVFLGEHYHASFFLDFFFWIIFFISSVSALFLYQNV